MDRFEPEYQKVVSPYDALAISDYTGWIDEINFKIKQLEDEKKKHYEWISQFIQNVTEPIYFVWYYEDENIGYNGGTTTFVTKTEFDKLLNHYKDGGLHIVDSRDVVESIKQQKVIYPDFLDEKYLYMIRNPEHNEWHKELLEKEKSKWKRV